MLELLVCVVVRFAWFAACFYSLQKYPRKEWKEQLLSG